MVVPLGAGKLDVTDAGVDEELLKQPDIPASCQSVESGVFLGVRRADEEGRIKFVKTTEFDFTLDHLVRPGTHAFFVEDLTARTLKTNDFSRSAKKLRQSTTDQHVTAIIPTLTATTSTPDTNHAPSSHLPPPSPSTVSTSHQPQPSTSTATTHEISVIATRTAYDVRRELMKNIHPPPVVTDTDTRHIFTFNDIGRLLDIAPCRECYAPLTFNVQTDCLSSNLIVTCTNCKNGTEFSDKEVRTNTGKKTSLQENNVKGIYEAVNNNIGLSGLNRVILTLGFNSLSKGKYTRYANFLYEEMGIKYPAMMHEGIKGMFQHYENCGIFPDPTTGLLDILAHRCWICCRGRHGIHSRQESYFQLLSSLPITPEWKIKHEPFCNKNFTGISAYMEAEAACRLWGRSTELRLRYTTFVGDGDSNTYLAIQQLNPYGFPVQKEECINHVSKRLGTRLRKLKKEMTTTVTTKTGKVMKKSVLGGAGQLTDNVINKLTRYFGKAIRGNKDKPNTSTYEIR
ncbi:hypothetical protein Pmani_006480 [Petrolisthes manimaculis]|uniref:Mutator-like transposase domain-containing protein n=1 Tax=Petrolisthes manimaculis TaxID=1843537 RepID=A0AAE1Q9T0_9EUCA|nr:hypothetical protein Pmani_006480 [Petrolisthes manimaculis]